MKSRSLSSKTTIQIIYCIYTYIHTYNICNVNDT
jgi:hypothetical protein